MSWRNKVVWSQGMFLQPHHFQQEARYVERLVDTRAQMISPHAWGYGDLQLDEGLLTLGKVAVTRATGMLPDGTPFDIPQWDAPPAALDVPADVKDEVIHLVAPLNQEGSPQSAFEGDANSIGPAGGSRYLALQETILDDTGQDPEPVDIQTARLRLRLVRERDLGEGVASLGVVKVLERRTDQALVLDRGYVPPQVRLDASGQLSATATLLHGLVRQRAQALAARMGQLSHGVSELADFLMLLVLNRHEPVLRQMSAAPSVHPAHLHEQLLMLAGELSTLCSASRSPPGFALYDHRNPRLSFDPLQKSLREMLTVVLEQNALSIELVQRKYGVHTAVVPDQDLVRTAGFVLAVAAQLPAEQIRLKFPAQTCVAPADLLRKLVNGNLPGIGMRALPVAPRQLPFHAGHHYFELDRSDAMWRQFEQSGSLALHVAGEFPGLEMELWAIRH